MGARAPKHDDTMTEQKQSSHHCLPLIFIIFATMSGTTDATTAQAPDATSPSIASMLENNPPPDALPPGWVMRRSRHNPSTCYYYNQDSGVSRWDPPRALATTAAPPPSSSEAAPSAGDQASASAPSILKRSAPSGTGGASENDPNAAAAAATAAASAEGSKQSPPAKKPRSSSSKPDQVRALHILKKHRGSRRPASWRRSKITDTKEKAIADLEELIAILKDSEDDPKELRATFEELAKTESDCTSAKRGGDLGFFGKRKMQKPFEDASFALGIGELSGVVETSSGVHVILRIG